MTARSSPAHPTLLSFSFTSHLCVLLSILIVLLSLVTPSSADPYIYSVGGCDSLFTSTDNCNTGSVLTIDGFGFGDTTLNDTLDVSLQRLDGLPYNASCTELVRVSDESILCTLPPPIDFALRGIRLCPIVTVNNRSTQSWGFFYSYGAPAPVLYSVHGCVDDPTNNSTVNCVAGQVVTLIGDYFTASYPGLSIRVGWNRIVDPPACVTLSQWEATCPLSEPETRQYGQLLTVEVMTFAGGSPARPLVEYAVLPPTVNRAEVNHSLTHHACKKSLSSSALQPSLARSTLTLVSPSAAGSRVIAGCPGQEGDMTTECKAMDIITIWGSRFDVGTTRAFFGGYEALWVTFYRNDYSIMAQLPLLPTEMLNQSLPVLVVSNGVNSSTAPLLVQYTPYNFDVWETRGCPTQYDRRTSDCRSGMTLTVVGTGFVEAVGVWMTDWGESFWAQCGGVQVLNSTYLTCVLPSVPADTWLLNLFVNQTWADGELNTVVFRNALSISQSAYVPSSSSSSSTASPSANLSSSSSCHSDQPSSPSSSSLPSSASSSISSSTLSPSSSSSSSSLPSSLSSSGSNSSSDASKSSRSSMSAGAVVGVVVAVLLGSGLVVALVFTAMRRKGIAALLDNSQYRSSGY